MIGSYCRSIIVVSSIATRTPCFGALRCCANDAAESPNDKKASPFPVKYLSLSTDDLFIQCRMDTYRASGPGGQHRNKTESAVRLKHLPTGIVSQACDDRSQHKNRALALQRLRQQIAAKVRNPVDLETYEPPAELLRILPKRAQEKSNQQIGPNHPDFPVGMQQLLDLLWAVGGSVSDVAKKLGLSTGAISKVLTSDRLLLQAANDIRAQKGMKALS